MNILGFDLSNSDIWLLAIAGACLTLLIAFWRDRHARYVVACATFRSAVDREIGFISVKWPDDIDRILRSHYPALLSAVKEFYHYVPWWQKRGFKRAWLCFYCAYPDKWDSQCYHHYIEYISPGETPPNVRAIFHNNVSRLLSYAKET